MIDPIELPRIGWITLSQAAERLRLTPWQARRWVRSGRLHAELRRGHEGPHYYVPVHQVEELAGELEMLANAAALPDGEPIPVDDAMLVRVILEMRTELQQAVESRGVTEAVLLEELNQIRAELAAGIQALKMARVAVEEPQQHIPLRRPWWHFWSGTSFS